MEFVSWQGLGTYAGALTMVIVITELVKNIGFLKKIPTQAVSYVIAVAVLLLAYFFTGELSMEKGVLTMFNGAIVALAANGGFVALKRSFPNLFNK